MTGSASNTPDRASTDRASTDRAATPAVPIPDGGPLRRLADGAVLVAAGGVARGRVTPPPSKSLSHRAFNLALLAGEELTVERPLQAADTHLFRTALATLGWTVEARGDDVHLTPGERPPSAEIVCGNAGTMYRFLVATLAALPGDWRLDGVPRLRERPVGPLVTALRRLGAEIDSERHGHAPLAIRGRRLASGRTRLDAGASSQYLSALLMAGLVAEGEIEIEVEALTSAPYVDLTTDLVARFGGDAEATATGWRVRPGLSSPGRLRVEGDWSAACYPAAAAALTGGRVTLDGMAADSRQGDRRFLELLREMGAAVTLGEDGTIEVAGTGALRALTADGSAIPDQVPTLAALAPFAAGVTRIKNVHHLRIKESDRLAAMAGELARVGAAVEELEDGLVIPGVWADGVPAAPPEPFRVDPRDDHRIAMALALVGLRRPGVAVADPHVVAKSYPGFWRDLAALTG
jgi:3-phosphoshikimate 1-carboxyvinyltransferase